MSEGIMSVYRQWQGDYEWLGPNSLSIVHNGQVATMGS